MPDIIPVKLPTFISLFEKGDEGSTVLVNANHITRIGHDPHSDGARIFLTDGYIDVKQRRGTLAAVLREQGVLLELAGLS